MSTQSTSPRIVARRPPWPARALASVMCACAVVLALGGAVQVFPMVQEWLWGTGPITEPLTVAGLLPLAAAILVAWSAAALLWRRPGAGPAAVLQLAVIAGIALLTGSMVLLALVVVGALVYFLGKALTWGR